MGRNYLTNFYHLIYTHENINVVKWSKTVSPISFILYPKVQRKWRFINSLESSI